MTVRSCHTDPRGVVGTPPVELSLEEQMFGPPHALVPIIEDGVDISRRPRSPSFAESMKDLPSFALDETPVSREKEVAKIARYAFKLDNGAPVDPAELKRVFEKIIHDERLWEAVADLREGIVGKLARLYEKHFPSDAQALFGPTKKEVKANEQGPVSSRDIQDLAFIEINLPEDLPVALLMCQVAQPLLDEMKTHIAGTVPSPQPCHSIFTYMKASPERFFAQLLEARIKNKPNIIDDIRAQVLSAIDTSVEGVSGCIQLILQTLEIPRIEKTTSLPARVFQYYLAKTLRQEKSASEFRASIGASAAEEVEKGTYQLDLGKISEIRTRLLNDNAEEEDACLKDLPKLSISDKAKKAAMKPQSLEDMRRSLLGPDVVRAHSSVPSSNPLSPDEMQRSFRANYIVECSKMTGWSKSNAAELDQFRIWFREDPFLQIQVNDMDPTAIPKLLGKT